MIDLVSQMKTINLLLNMLQGNLEHCTPYPFVPFLEKPIPDRSLNGLETSTPEEQGVESAWLNGFFGALRDAESVHLHSVAVLRHGKLIAEGSFKPYTGAYPHMQFSLSKSVVGMAVGIAVAEGRLSVQDQLIHFFSEDRQLFPSPRMQQVTIQHLLQMTSGVKYNEIFSETDRDWVHGYLTSDCAFEPGSAFSYNSMNSYMLSAVLQKVTGQSLVEYLMPRLFGPMQIPRPRWETCPMGITKGGWGLYLRTVDMAKLGQLYLQKGRWQCARKMRQLVPEKWVVESVSNMVKTSPKERDSGYGYQLWKFPVERAFQYSGIYGQHVVVLPHLDAVVALTSGSQTFVTDESSEIIARYFAKDAAGFHPEALAPDVHSLRSLKETLTHLYAVRETEPPRPPAKRPFFSLFQKAEEETLQPRALPQIAEQLDGRSYRVTDGTGTIMPLSLQIFINQFPAPLKRVTLGFTPGMCRVVLQCGEETNTITAGLENEPFRGYVTYGEETYPVGCSARITTDEEDRPVLKLFLSFLQTPFTRILKFIFYDQGEKMLVRMNESPSIQESVDMIFRLLDEGNGLQKRFSEVVTQQKMQKRMLARSLPKLHGVLEHPEEPPQKKE